MHTLFVISHAHVLFHWKAQYGINKWCQHNAEVPSAGYYYEGVEGVTCTLEEEATEMVETTDDALGEACSIGETETDLWIKVVKEK